ncbi:MAG: hypothetical protein KJO34_08420 [Deltaproteobacteria bacterium]|nr:hypothetical protein [Deltaproteobacteria bacterium]
MMKKFIWLCWVFIVFGGFSQPLLAQEEDFSNEPWEKAALYLGAFFVHSNSDLELGGGGLNVKVDAEEVLGLDENFTVFRADAFWRITRRNRVDFTYYAMNRDGTNDLSVAIPDPDGGSFPVGTKIKTDFDMTILRGSYNWSFFKNQHVDLGIGAGLYGMAVDFKLKREGTIGSNKEKTDFTFPLPVIGLRGSFALTPKWFIRQSFDYLYVNIGDYEGYLVDFLAAVEWNALKYVGLGVGYNYVQMNLDYSGGDDFLSEIDLSYGGVLAYAKLYF